MVQEAFFTFSKSCLYGFTSLAEKMWSFALKIYDQVLPRQNKTYNSKTAKFIFLQAIQACCPIPPKIQDKLEHS